MVEKTNQVDSNSNGATNQLDLLRNILFGEFTSKYEKRIELLEQRIEKLNVELKGSNKEVEAKMTKAIKEADGKMSKVIKETGTILSKAIKESETKLEKTVNDIEVKFEKSTEGLSKQIDVRFVENRNALSSEIRKVEEEKDSSMTELADLFVDLAAKIKKL